MNDGRFNFLGTGSKCASQATVLECHRDRVLYWLERGAEGLDADTETVATRMKAKEGRPAVDEQARNSVPWRRI